MKKREYRRVYFFGFLKLDILCAVSAIVCLLLMSGCSENPSPIPAPAYRVSVTEVDVLDKSIWHALLADLNGDGDTDIFVGGHSTGSLVYYAEGDGFGKRRRLLKQKNDRHACAAADVDLDGDQDLYCSTGAGKGQMLNPNELWLNEAEGVFVSAPSTFGAEEPSSRGRLTKFLNFNNDEFPDLALTVWGDRSDDERNESTIFINHNGFFDRVETSFTGKFGAHGIVIVDANNDGLDDFIADDQYFGASLFTNKGNGQFDRRPLKSFYSKVWGLASYQYDGTQDILVGILQHDILQRQQVEVRVASDHKVDEAKVVMKMACDSINTEAVSDLFCSALTFAFLNDDDYVDLYISRRRGWRLNAPVGDAQDVILLGPDYQRYVEVPIAKYGAGYMAIANGRSVIRVSAGEKWGGSIDVIRLGVLPEVEIEETF